MWGWKELGGREREWWLGGLGLGKSEKVSGGLERGGVGGEGEVCGWCGSGGGG